MAVAISQTAAPAGVAASSNVATYTGVSIGAAADDRIVAVVVGTELASSTPSACTIGGVSASSSTTGNFGALYARIFYLAVPTGTTADIAVTYSATNPGNTANKIAVYRITGGTVTSTGGDGSTDMDATDPLTTGSISIPSSGGFLAVAAGATDTVAKTWANATEDIDADVGTFRFTTATRTTSGTVTVTCTGATNGEDGAMAWAIITPYPVVEQSAYRYYEDGTENGSTAIDSQNTNITRDVTSGDSNLQLRVRLQETNGGAGASTDDYQLQYELNDSGVYNTIVTATENVGDNFAVANDDGAPAALAFSGTTALGQSFIGNGGVLTKVQFNLSKLDAPSGTLSAKVYAHSGTFGSSSVPTGAALATATTTYTQADLTTTPTLYDFTFSGINQITLTAATNYVVVIETSVTGGGGSNDFLVGRRSVGGHAGNGSVFTGSWAAISSDFIFYIYTTSQVLAYNSASLTDGNATTSRLTTKGEIEFISANAVEGNSMTLPSHQLGDLLIMVAARDDSTTAPSVPSDWTQPTNPTNTGTTSAMTVAYKWATSNADTSGTWTNAGALACHVYRGVARGLTHPITKHAGGNGTGTTVNYSGITTMDEASDSWGLRFSMHSSTDTALNTAPSGFTNRSNNTSPSTIEIAGFDTNGAAASVSFAGVSVGGTSGNWVSQTLEINSADFVAGKISEDGLVDNVELTAGNYTDLLYSLTIDSDAVADNDTLDFRVLRNGATTGMTYTVTPRITIEKSAGDDHTLVTQDIALALTEDATTIAQNHVITAQDMAIATREDNTTITQNHVIVTQDIALGTSTDNTTVAETHIISANDVALATTLDATTITQNHVLSPDDIAFSTSADNDTITQNHVIVTQDVALSTTIDTTTVAETNFVIATQDVAVSSNIDTTTITQDHVVVTQDIALATTADATTIAQNHVITTDDIALATTIDATTVSVGTITIETADVTLGTSIDTTTITQNHVISADDIAFTTTTDNTTVEETNFSLTVQDISLATSLDNATITQNQILAVQDLALSLSEDNATISQLHVVAAEDVGLSVTTDNGTITQNHVIAANDITVTASVDSAGLEGGTIIRKYYIDTSGNVYFVINQTLGIVERI